MLEGFLYVCKAPRDISDDECLTYDEFIEKSKQGITFIDENNIRGDCSSIYDNCKFVDVLFPEYDYFQIANIFCDKYGLDYTPDMEEKIKISAKSDLFVTFSFAKTKKDVFELTMTAEEKKAVVVFKKKERVAVCLKEVEHECKEDFSTENLKIKNYTYTDDYDFVMYNVNVLKLSDKFYRKLGPNMIFHVWW